MPLSQTDRISALILAKNINNKAQLFDMRGDLGDYVRRLNETEMFSIGELAEISKLSEWKIRKLIPKESRIVSHSGVKPRHIDHLIRMIVSKDFARKHLPYLIKEDVPLGAISRITGISKRTLENWRRKYEEGSVARP